MWYKKCMIMSGRWIPLSWGRWDMHKMGKRRRSCLRVMVRGPRCVIDSRPKPWRPPKDPPAGL